MTAASLMRSLVLVLAAASCTAAAELPKHGRIRFEKKQLADNLAEGCAIADVNKDGKLDVIAGPSWYEAPTWKAHPVRDMKPQGPENQFFGTNGDHAYDVNGDGWVDVVTASWFSDKTFWYENPGKDLARGENWKEHVISEGRSECEGTLFQDIDGDKVPELVLNRWNAKTPLTIVKITPGHDGSEPKFQVIDVGDHSGHGLGIGDINGDGRTDLLISDGWYEAPAKITGEWKFHKAFGLPPHTSLPNIVTDLTGDGKNDVIMGQGHDYGLIWFEQGPVKEGEITWTKHDVDKSFSQVHCLAWEDLDGDGKKELITGKRWRAHNDGDPGAAEPI